jgi:hypothetical protein
VPHGRSGTLRGAGRGRPPFHNGRPRRVRQGGGCCRRPRGGTGAIRASDAKRSEHADVPISRRRSSCCPGAALMMRAAHIGPRSSGGIYCIWFPGGFGQRQRRPTRRPRPQQAKGLEGSVLARRNVVPGHGRAGSVGAGGWRLLVGVQAPPKRQLVVNVQSTPMAGISYNCLLFPLLPTESKRAPLHTDCDGGPSLGHGDADAVMLDAAAAAEPEPAGRHGLRLHELEQPHTAQIGNHK